jgi:hypothetical protein
MIFYKHLIWVVESFAPTNIQQHEISTSIFGYAADARDVLHPGN